MDRALLLLLWLRACGWLRRLSRNLLTVRGIVLLVLTAMVMGSCLLSFLFGPSPIPTDPEKVRRYGTLGFLAYCLMSLLFSSIERAIYFTPAEVNFLFPGPFS